MPSQIKYIVEACVALLLAVVTVKTIQLFSHTNIIGGPGSTTVEFNQPENISSKNAEGKKLFIDNCARCHSIARKIVGPPLGGITDRVHNRELLISWVRNNQKVLQSGDPYFNSLFQEYNRFPMDVFPQLDDKQIDAILNYVDGK
jgi:mono/diheme cytochrome c family protein